MANITAREDCDYFDILADMNPTLYYTNLITCIINMILSLSAAVGNAFIIVAFVLNTELHTVSNILLLSLCICDFVVGLVVHPLFVASHIDVVIPEPPICPRVDVFTYSGIAITISGASFLTLANISVERYLAVCFPFKYVMYCTKMKMITTMITLWIIGIMTGMTRFMGLPVATTGYMVTFVMIVAILVILHSYLSIFRVALRHRKAIFAQTQNFTGPSNHAREMKTTITMCIILCTFFLSYSPTLVIYTISNGTEKFNTYLWYVFPWSDTMAYISSSLNPIIYCIRNREIRRAVSGVLKFLKPRVRSPLHVQNTGVTDLRTDFSHHTGHLLQ